MGLSEEEAEAAFAVADANKNGKIDYEEFLAWLWTDAPDQARKQAAL